MPTDTGYVAVNSDGKVYCFGTTPSCQSATQLRPGFASGIVATPTGGGYWVFDALGHVYAFGTAQDYPFDTVPGAPAA